MKLVLRLAGILLAMGSQASYGQTAIAQTPGRETVFNNHVWLSFFHNSRLSDRWSFQFEGHARRADLGAAWQQYMVRPYMNFHLNPDIIFTAGYAFYVNVPYEEKAFQHPFNEHHAWEQVQLSHAFDRLVITHRYRLEQRFLDTYYQPDPANDPTWVKGNRRYLNRFRYKLNFTVPFNHEKMEKGTFFATAADEVFLTFGDDSRLDGIQQNRATAMLGWQFDRVGSNIQLGFLYQTLQFNRVPQANPAGAGGLTDDLIENNRTLHLQLTLNIDWRGKKGFVPWLPRGSRRIKVKGGPTKKKD